MIGVISGFVCYWSVATIKPMFGYDDSLDAFGVHGVGGTLGAILTGAFASEAVGGASGLIEGNFQQLVNNTVGVFGTWVFAGVATFILLKVVDAITGLRVEETTEVGGLDIAEHGEEAYQL